MHSVLLTVTIGAILLITYIALGQHQLDEAQTDLMEESPEYQQAAAHRPPGEELISFTMNYLLVHPLPSGTQLIIGIDGNEVGSSPKNSILAAAPRVRELLAHPPTSAVTTNLDVGSGSFRVVADPVMANGHVVGALVAGVDLGVVQQEVLGVLPVIAGEAGAALVIALVAGYLLLHRVRRTISGLSDTAAKITRDDLSRRLDYTGPEDELGRLVKTFNTMLERLETSFNAQRRLLSDVSHQLRTPLTVIRGNLDVLRRAGLNDPAEAADTIALVVNEIDHTNKLVDQLLILGQSAEPAFLNVERVDLRSFLADLFTSVRGLARRRWVLEAVPDLVVRIDENKIRGALLNLLDNSVRATRPEDTIALGASSNGDIVITVTDTGSGIAVTDQEKVFERFVHKGKDHGSGLGLTIVRSIAEAHGGRVELRSDVGKGCRVALMLPRAVVDGTEAQDGES